MGFFSSPSVLRKKANNLFGIQFDDAKYNKLGKLLETISERRELVSIFMCLIYVAIIYCFGYFIGNVITFTYKVPGLCLTLVLNARVKKCLMIICNRSHELFLTLKKIVK